MGNIHGGKLKDANPICLGVKISRQMHRNIVNTASEKSLTLSDIVRMAIQEYLAKT